MAIWQSNIRKVEITISNELIAQTNSRLADMEFEFHFSSPNKALKFSLIFHQLAVAEVRRAVRVSTGATNDSKRKVKVLWTFIVSAVVGLNDSEKSTEHIGMVIKPIPSMLIVSATISLH